MYYTVELLAPPHVLICAEIYKHISLRVEGSCVGHLIEQVIIVSSLQVEGLEN